MEDRPWPEWGRSNRPITAPSLARQLKHFHVSPNTVRDGSTTFKGYTREQFRDVFARYLPDTPDPTVTPSQVSETAGYSENLSVTLPSNVTDGNPEKPEKSAGCDGVTDGNPQNHVDGVDLLDIPAFLDRRKQESCSVCDGNLYRNERGVTWLLDNGEPRHKQCPHDE